jgi:hypothetical protein
MGKRPASVNVQPCSSILLMLVPVAQSCPSLPLRQRGGRWVQAEASPALGRNVPHVRLRRKKNFPRTYSQSYGALYHRPWRCLCSRAFGYADLQDKQETQRPGLVRNLLLLFGSGLLRIYSTATRKSKIPGTPASERWFQSSNSNRYM